MGIFDKIRETVSYAGDEHRHTPADDAWEQVVSAVGPKMAEGLWEVIPQGLRDVLSKPGAENIFQILSYGFARILPNKGVGTFVNTLQREIAGELREMAQKHRSGESREDSRESASAPGAASSQTGSSTVEGSNQILRLELKRAERVAAWLACLRVADLPDLKPEDVAKFLDKLTLRELRTFADLSDEAKRVYAEARIGKPLPKSEPAKAENKILLWLGARWDSLSEILCRLNSDLEEIALLEDERIEALQKEYAQLCEEEEPERIGWKFWKIFKRPEWQVWKF